MQVFIIDHGMANLGSLKRSVEECGGSVLISDNPSDMKYPDRIILPGVGTFADGMKSLLERDWISAIKSAVEDKGIPLLGICLGMQLLADIGFEGGERSGLGLISGEVKRLKPNSPGERIPHAGWNEVHIEKPSILLEGIEEGTDFYFVHSYHFVPKSLENVLAYTPYCEGIVSAIKSNNVYGVQFHPEKSQKPGFRVLSNFLLNGRGEFNC